MSKLIAKEYKCFEDIKNIRSDGSEFRYARELAPVLDYTKRTNGKIKAKSQERTAYA